MKLFFGSFIENLCQQTIAFQGKEKVYWYGMLKHSLVRLLIRSLWFNKWKAKTIFVMISSRHKREPHNCPSHGREMAGYSYKNVD